MRRIIKVTGLIIVFFIAGGMITMLFRQHLTYDAPYPQIKVSTELMIIERGKQLAITNGCVGCHNPVNNVDSLFRLNQEPTLKGGRELNNNYGTLYSSNITPDVKTGIGQMTDAEIARVLKYGVKKNGEAVLPYMRFEKLDDESISAIISFLRPSKAVENKVPKNNYSVIGRFAKAFMVKPVEPIKTAASVIQ